MNSLNYIFFEEYKHLEKLCREMYRDKDGVTNYINDMEKAPLWDCANIPNWKTDLEQLKRLRHIRNNLAHTEGAFDEQTCTQADIDWIKNFYNRIMKQFDPLAVLHQKSMAKNTAARQNYNAQNSMPKQTFYAQNPMPNKNVYKQNNTYNYQNNVNNANYANYVNYENGSSEYGRKNEKQKNRNSFSVVEFIYYTLIIAIIILLAVMVYLLCTEFLI